MGKAAVVCTSLLVGLFGYTAASKMLQRDAFRAVLEQVPHLKTGAAALFVWLPLAELLVVLLLLVTATGLAGLYASFLLLFLLRATWCTCWQRHHAFRAVAVVG